MENVKASQQTTRWEGQDLSGSPLDSFAFEQKSKMFIYDISGVKKEDRIEGDEALAYQCNACLKNFTTKQSLERHHERFPLCRFWEKNDEPMLKESVYNWALDKIEEALCTKENPKKCKFCEVEFASVGNFHKHFKTSVVCNRLGMREIKKGFA